MHVFLIVHVSMCVWETALFKWYSYCKFESEFNCNYMHFFFFLFGLNALWLKISNHLFYKGCNQIALGVEVHWNSFVSCKSDEFIMQLSSSTATFQQQPIQKYLFEEDRYLLTVQRSVAVIVLWACVHFGVRSLYRKQTLHRDPLHLGNCHVFVCSLYILGKCWG